MNLTIENNWHISRHFPSSFKTHHLRIKVIAYLMNILLLCLTMLIITLYHQIQSSHWNFPNIQEMGWLVMQFPEVEVAKSKGCLTIFGIWCCSQNQSHWNFLEGPTSRFLNIDCFLPPVVFRWILKLNWVLKINIPTS